MYVRIYWGRVAPGSWEALERKYAQLMTMPVNGLVGRYVMRDVNDPGSLYGATSKAFRHGNHPKHTRTST